AYRAQQAEGMAVRTSGGLSEEWNRRTYAPENLWAYRPLVKPPVPSPHLEAAGDVHPVDAFIDHRLSELGLSAAPRADRRVLIRRATFDLIGMPPTSQEIAEFVNDPESDQRAFTTVIERLLASPHYGEQWGRHWMDVVRYADSSGFANDYERGNAWRYRDYVIRAFNDDKPYDRFVREQLAGDEIDAEDPELLVATGFLRMGPWELTGMEVAKVARQRFLDDVTDSVGQVFLAHPLQCARCHDHKFDPIPTRDYYAMQAVFATTQPVERRAAFLPFENTAGFEERKYVEQRRGYYEQVLNALDIKSFEAARRWYDEQGLDATDFERFADRSAGKPGRGPSYQSVRQKLMQNGIPENRIPPRHAGFTPQDYGMERVARKGLERLRWILERYEPYAFGVYSGRTPDLKSVYAPQRMPPNRTAAGELEKTCILAGGDPFSPTEPVEPGVLSVLESLQDRSSLPSSATRNEAVSIGTLAVAGDGISGRRLALADWIISPENSLTARVMANRLWQWHFGQAIAGNPNNFGATGKKPTHPALLDWLAVTLMENGWSIKAMHRRIMTSEAYRRSSHHPDIEAVTAKDPGGTSYAVFLPRRLDAEELRDATLCISGELNPALGGIPIRPEINLETALQPRQVMGTFAEAWQPSPRPEQRHRRSVYALRIRGVRDPFMEVFNAPAPDTSCEARDASTVTPQVFAMFNSPIAFDRALAMAERLRRETDSREESIARAFELVFGRSPEPDESAACLAHWQRMEQRHQKLQFEPPRYPREVLREAVEENTGQRFQFREPLEFYEDFVPDLKPSDADASLRGLAEVCLILLNSNEFAYVY
ncbi:MAG: DUF1549 and DUF1553 domain-containing protein, partial [Planctomycetes bacterium]|nr:DUF1549 and DUF1553 domain-containing protein [Planctomycetota bacterium]